MHTESSQHRSLSSVVTSAVVVFSVFCCGCGHPELTPEGYEIAKALHTTLVRRDSETLRRAADHIAAAHRAGHISIDEFELFIERIADANNGDWDNAANSVRELLAAQTVE